MNHTVHNDKGQLDVSLCSCLDVYYIEASAGLYAYHLQASLKRPNLLADKSATLKCDFLLVGNVGKSEILLATSHLSGTFCNTALVTVKLPVLSAVSYLKSSLSGWGRKGWLHCPQRNPFHQEVSVRHHLQKNFFPSPAGCYGDDANSRC